MVAAGSSLSRFCTLMVLGTETGIRSILGEGRNVRKGGRGDGRSREVYLGSNRREEGVMVLSRMANASFDPYSEAVVRLGGASA